MLVFKPAPNIVYCSWSLLFVNVVQLLFRPKFGQNGCFRLKFRSRRLWRRISRIRTRTSPNFGRSAYETEGLMGNRFITRCSFGPISVKIRPFWDGMFQIRVIWGLQRPQKALLFNKIPSVQLLLFMAPNINIVEVLTIRTVFCRKTPKPSCVGYPT